MSKKRIAVVGATGFTGSELVRILHQHPFAEVIFISSESKAGQHFADIHPFFQDIVDIKLEKAEGIKNHAIDLAFLALPHGVSMSYVKDFADMDFPIIDLSGDFRLSDADIYEKWYQKDHSYREGFDKAVYGLPELYADKIKSARLIANPGCYPTSVILGAAPAIRSGLADNAMVIADAKSGVTGAGIKSKPVNHFSMVNDNFKAYGLKNHRHSIEIEEKLNLVGSNDLKVQFTPHLLPVDRGILSTIYIHNSETDTRTVQNIYREAYKDAPFVRLVEHVPAIKNVRGTNYCDIFVTHDDRTGNIIIISAIDNLVKGAAGQAIQNMNLVFGWDEQAGLGQIPLSP